jgi:hypothetical protein
MAHQNQVLCLQDVLVRMRDSVVGAFKPDFLDKTADSADLCARCPPPLLPPVLPCPSCPACPYTCWLCSVPKLPQGAGGASLR